MNYAQKILFGKLRELQYGRRKHNYFAATSEEKHWKNEFDLIKAIKILSVSSHETSKVRINKGSGNVCLYIRCPFNKYDACTNSKLITNCSNREI